MLPNIETLLNIGIALSKEKDAGKLQETILDAAMSITNCDAGMLYILEDDILDFEILVVKSKGVRVSAGAGVTELTPVPLSSRRNVCSRAAMDKTPINVADIYNNDEYDFSGAKFVDSEANYKSVSVLSVPMFDDHDDVIGVLQLVNAQDQKGSIIPFAGEYEPVIFSLASQAAICLTNRNYAVEVTGLLDSFVRVMSAAIDARSPYNANHTRNMARYAEEFIIWLNANSDISISFDETRTKQFLMSVWLHDVGKLVVPLEIMDKESRLGQKLHRVLDRFRLLEVHNENNYLRKNIGSHEYDRRADEISKARALTKTADTAGFITDEMLAEIRMLGEKAAYGPDGKTVFLTEDELICLTVRKGTLTDEERRVIEGHVLMTRRMLREMNFPKHYREVPDWASAHHEYLNGKGYPNGLAGELIPMEVRILTILDVYDALTAEDRPYKPPMPAEKAFAILDNMAKDGQIDPDLLELFKKYKKSAG
jgi:HD-GYP domain-containing protein (c-di-GMP phosphodiesterase class II)